MAASRIAVIKTIISIACLLFLIPLVSGCPATRPPPLVAGNLTLSSAPLLGKPIQVIYTFWINNDITKTGGASVGSVNAEAGVTLSNRFELVEGDLQWQGVLNDQSRVEIKATIQAVQKGTCQITANTSVTRSQGRGENSSNTLYALILTDRGFFSDKLEDLPGEGGVNPVGFNQFPREPVVIQSHLSIPNPPSLGKTAELIFTMTALADANLIQASVRMPPELKIISGNLEWSGNLAKGETLELKAVIKATSVGKWTIQSDCYYSPHEAGGVYVLSVPLTLYVFKDGADTVESPPLKSPPQVSIELSFSSLPALHEKAELTCVIVALDGDLPKAQIGVNWRTSGFQLIIGDDYWRGALQEGIPLELKLVLEPTVTGTLGVMADVAFFDENSEMYSWLTDKKVYVSVTATSASLVDPPTYILPSTLHP